MIDLVITDASTVSVAGASVTGPFHATATDVTVSGVTYSEGTILVNGGTATVLAEMAREHVIAMPYAFFAAILCGMVMGGMRR